MTRVIIRETFNTSIGKVIIVNKNNQYSVGKTVIDENGNKYEVIGIQFPTVPTTDETVGLIVKD